MNYDVLLRDFLSRITMNYELFCIFVPKLQL